MKKLTKFLSVAGLLMCATVGLTACGGEGTDTETPTPDPIPPTPQVVYTVDEATWNVQLSPANLNTIKKFTQESQMSFGGLSATQTCVLDGYKFLEKLESDYPDDNFQFYWEKFSDEGQEKLKKYTKQKDGEYLYTVLSNPSDISTFEYKSNVSQNVSSMTYDQNLLIFSNFEYDGTANAYKLFRENYTIEYEDTNTTLTNLEITVSFEDGVVKSLTLTVDEYLSTRRIDQSINYQYGDATMTLFFGEGTVTLPENATEQPA